VPVSGGQGPTRHTTQRRRPVLWRLALALLLWLAAVVLAFTGPTFPQEPETFCPGYRPLELTGVETTSRLWPPGVTDCRYTTPAGEVKHSSRLAWREFLILSLLLATAALALWWVATLKSQVLRGLLIAVVVAPSTIVFLVLLWTFPLVVVLLLVSGAVVWKVRRG
jgi:hypothetical protein